MEIDNKISKNTNLFFHLLFLSKYIFRFVMVNAKNSKLDKKKKKKKKSNKTTLNQCFSFD